MHFVDVSEVGGGQLQGGDFVALGVTEGHQHVQLVAVDANPPPATEDSVSVAAAGASRISSLCSPALPLHQVVPLLPTPGVPRAASSLRAAARPFGAVSGGFHSRGGLGAVVAPAAPGGSGRLRRGVCGKGQTDTAGAHIKNLPWNLLCRVAGTLAVDGVPLPRRAAAVQLLRFASKRLGVVAERGNLGLLLLLGGVREVAHHLPSKEGAPSDSRRRNLGFPFLP